MLFVYILETIVNVLILVILGILGWGVYLKSKNQKELYIRKNKKKGR